MPQERDQAGATTGRLHALVAALPVTIAAYSSGSNGMRTKLALPVRDPTTTPCRSMVSTIALALALSRSSASVTSRRSLIVPKRLGRVDVVEEVPDRHAEPPLAEVAPDAMGRGVRRTRGVGADFAWHRAENGAIGVERDELSEAGGEWC